MKKALLALLSLALLAVFAMAADDDTEKKEHKKLEGTWKIVSQTKDGENTSKEKLAEMRVIFEAGGKWKVKQGDKVVLEGKVTMDPSKKPKEADWILLVEGEDKGKALGIYEFEKDQFKHCFHLTERPSKFESKEGSGVTNSVFERVKKK